jgi:hypothetical protein
MFLNIRFRLLSAENSLKNSPLSKIFFELMSKLVIALIVAASSYGTQTQIEFRFAAELMEKTEKDNFNIFLHHCLPFSSLFYYL